MSWHRHFLAARLAGAAVCAALCVAGCGGAEKSAAKAYDRGLAAESRGDSTAAAADYARAIAAGEKSGPPQIVALAHARLGGMALRARDLASALQHFQAGVAAAREAPDQNELGNLLNNVGLVHKALGDESAAESNYLEAVAESHRVNNLAGEAAALNNLGAILRDRGDVARARDLYLRALGVARISADSVSIARALISIGDLERSQNLTDDATEAYQQAIETIQAVAPNSPEIGYAYLSKGRILDALGDRPSAHRCFLLAQAQYRKAGDPRGEAATAAELGGIAIEEGRMEEAINYLSEAAPAMRDGGHLEELSNVLVKLALARGAAGDTGGAVVAYREALEARARLGDAGGAAMIYMNLGALFEGAGDMMNAGVAYQQALDALAAAGDTTAAQEANAAIRRIKERGAARLLQSQSR